MFYNKNADFLVVLYTIVLNAKILIVMIAIGSD